MTIEPCNLSILFIEDNHSLLEGYGKLLKRLFKTVYLAGDGSLGLELYQQFLPDILLVDIHLPKLNGLDLIKEIRKDDLDTKIVVQSSLNDTDTLLKAIPLKINKYLVKPISIDEFMMTFQTIIDDITKVNNFSIFNQDIYYDKNQLVLIENGNIIKLTKKEIKLIELFTTQNNIIINKEDLFTNIWENDIEYNLTKLSSLITRLNNKLNKKLIISKYGLGYKINIY